MEFKIIIQMIWQVETEDVLTVQGEMGQVCNYTEVPHCFFFKVIKVNNKLYNVLLDTNLK